MSQATRLHVIAVAQRMGYRGNGTARQLRTGTQESILVELDGSSTCYPDGTLTQFWHRVVTGFVRTAGEHGYRTVVAIDSSPDELARSSAAAIVYATMRPDTLALPEDVGFGSLRRFAAAPEELVSSDGRFTDLALGYDFLKIGRVLGAHLVNRAGVRRLLVVRGESPFPAIDLLQGICDEIASMTEIPDSIEGTELRELVAEVMRADEEIDAVLDLANLGPTILRGITDARGHESIGYRNGVTMVRACEVPPSHLHDPRVMYLSLQGMIAGKMLARAVLSAMLGEPPRGQRLLFKIVDPLMWSDNELEADSESVTD